MSADEVVVALSVGDTGDEEPDAKDWSTSPCVVVPASVSVMLGLCSVAGLSDMPGLRVNVDVLFVTVVGFGDEGEEESM